MDGYFNCIQRHLKVFNINTCMNIKGKDTHFYFIIYDLIKKYHHYFNGNIRIYISFKQTNFLFNRDVFYFIKLIGEYEYNRKKASSNKITFIL